MLEREFAALEQHVEAEALFAPPAQPAPKQPESIHPFSELSGGVARAFLISWGIFTLVVVLAFSGHLDVVFNLGVVLAFGAMFFAVPFILLRIKRKPAAAPKRFIDTPNGRMSQTEVMAQMVMVPLILSVGMAIIGYLATHQ